jgi:hypothetical protein
MKTFRTISIVALTLGVLCFGACAYAGDLMSLFSALSLAALGTGFLMKDALLKSHPGPAQRRGHDKLHRH